MSLFFLLNDKEKRVLESVGTMGFVNGGNTKEKLKANFERFHQDLGKATRGQEYSISHVNSFFYGSEEFEYRK